MRINRLFEMVYLLLERNLMTAKELAEYFEVSERTILRDVETLSASGVPIYTMQGKGGGIAILENYILNKTAISDEEQEHILFGLKGLEQARYLETEEIYGRLSALFGKTGSDWLAVDHSRWGDSQRERNTFSQIRQALGQSKALSLDYADAKGQQFRRIVYPLRLAYKGEAWYLQAYCTLREDYRTFRLSRIVAIESLEEVFIRDNFILPALEPDMVPEGKMVLLELLFSPETAFRVYDGFSMEEIELLEDGWLRLVLELPEDGWLYSFLLSFGPGVTVISPERVKNNLLELVERIKENYSL